MALVLLRQDVFPTIVGKPKNARHYGMLRSKRCLLGGGANESRNVLNITYPIKQGIIQDLGRHGRHMVPHYTELKVPPD